MKKNTLKKELDWVSMLVPLAIVLTVCALFMIFPEGSKLVLSVVRGFLGDDFGLYYALLGVGIVGCTLYIAFSKFGKIKLGDCEKPQYRSFQWGTMILHPPWLRIFCFIRCASGRCMPMSRRWS